MEKAPGPDDFPMSFCLAFWDVLKEYIQDFHANVRTEKSFNAIYVALIPKKAGALELKDL